MSDDNHRLRIRREIARRLDAITAEPDAVLLWDSDGDGRLNEREFAMLQAVVEAHVVLTETYWAVVHVDLARTPKIRAVLDYLSEEAARMETRERQGMKV